MISTIYKSLLRAVSDLIQDINNTTGEGVQYWPWESRADENEMPRTDLLGIDGYSFDENGGLWVVSAGITLSSYEDVNLHKEAEMLDMIFETFGEGKKFFLRRSDDGQVFDEMVISAFRLMPMGQSEFRNYRTVGIEFRRTSNAIDPSINHTH